MKQEKKSKATWKRYSIQEFAVQGNQNIFLLFLFNSNACSMSGYFISASGSPFLSDILESIYSEKKLSTAYIFYNIKRTRRKFKM